MNGIVSIAWWLQHVLLYELQTGLFSLENSAGSKRNLIEMMDGIHDKQTSFLTRVDVVTP